MRLLVVSQWFPYPPVNGAKQRAYHLIKGLSSRHEVDLLTFTQGPADLEHAHQLESICSDFALIQGKNYRPTKANAIRAMLSSRPRSVIDCRNEAMMSLVEDRLQKKHYDAALALTTMTAEYLLHAPVPKILDDDNVDCEYFHRLIELSSGLMSKFRQKLTWVKVARHERWLVGRYDAALTVSDEDRQSLARLCPDAARDNRLHVVPNGVDLSLMDYVGGEVDPGQLISTGALTYHANLDAAAYFCREIFPRIKSALSNARFVITGGYQGVDTRPLDAVGTQLTGFVDDIRPLLTSSAALVVPLRIGGGTRLKILEAMALGTPVVSTTLGAAGLGLRHEETAMLADTPQAFADCTVRLMQYPELRRGIAANARDYVAANFGWGKSVAGLEKVLMSVTRQEMQ